jgi:hypothetical protein
MQPQQGVSFGRATEITRDELKFAKFVGRLRKKFNTLFQDMLKTQLMLKGIITEDDWITVKERVQFKYAQDQYFEEMKESENLRNRVDIITAMQPFVGTYFSREYIMKNVLRLSEEEISQMVKQIEAEPVPEIGVGGQPIEQPEGN